MSSHGFRLASAADADAIAHLHAMSWRGHYRGAYADAFLDGDVLADRLATWRERLSEDDPRRYTLIAESPGPIGFANTYLEHDPTWGALVDNLHVAAERQREGIGAALLARTAGAVVERAGVGRSGLYLWVLEQNTAAQAFYAALGGSPCGRERVTSPGGVHGRLNGRPFKLRYAWEDAALLSARGNAS